MQIKPDATRRFLFLSILQLFSFLVPSAKLPTSEPYGFVQLEVKLLLDLIQVKVTSHRWLLTQNEITKTRMKFICCECIIT